MPINDGTGVTPGHICYSCALFQARQCPYGNHNKQSVLEFKAEPNGVCMVYQPVEEEIIMAMETTQKLIKKASTMTDSELNVELYRMIRAMDGKSQREFVDYWDYIYPDTGYAEAMASDKNESKPHGDEEKKKKKRRKKMHERFPETFRSDWYGDDKDKDSKEETEGEDDV